jgi:hypothetical protein
MKTAKLEKVAPVELGDTWDLRGKRYTAGPKCDTNSGVWFCTTHRRPFDNQLSKDAHLTTRGRHRLAWICFAHGPEVP